MKWAGFLPSAWNKRAQRNFNYWSENACYSLAALDGLCSLMSPLAQMGLSRGWRKGVGGGDGGATANEKQRNGKNDTFAERSAGKRRRHIPRLIVLRNFLFDSAGSLSLMNDDMTQINNTWQMQRKNVCVCVCAVHCVVCQMETKGGWAMASSKIHTAPLCVECVWTCITHAVGTKLKNNIT